MKNTNINQLLNLNNDDLSMIKRILKVDDDDVKFLEQDYLLKLKKFSYNELKKNIGVSFSIIKINNKKYEDFINHEKDIKKIVSKIISLENPLSDIETNNLLKEIIDKNYFIRNNNYIAQEVFTNSIKNNENLPLDHNECCLKNPEYPYRRFFDNDIDLKKDFLSFKMNDRNLSKGIDIFINEIIKSFKSNYNIFLPEYNSKKIKNILKSKLIKKKINIVQNIIYEIEKISKYYLERPTEDNIKTVYLKDISNHFQTYETPEIINNKVYTVNKIDLTVKEVNTTLHFSLSKSNINELNNGNFFVNFIFRDEYNKSFASYQSTNDGLYMFSDYYIFSKKDDAISFSNYKIKKLMEYFDYIKYDERLFSKETFNKLIDYFNKVKDINNKI